MPFVPDANAELVADEYKAWSAKVWPKNQELALPKTIEEARTRFVNRHRLLSSREHSVTINAIKDVKDILTVEDARQIASEWPLYEPAIIRRPLQVVMAENDAVGSVGRLVSTVTARTPQSVRSFVPSSRSSTAFVVLEQRAEVLESLFADLQRFEASTTSSKDRRNLQRLILQPIIKFLDEAHSVLEQHR